VKSNVNKKLQQGIHIQSFMQLAKIIVHLSRDLFFELLLFYVDSVWSISSQFAVAVPGFELRGRGL